MDDFVLNYTLQRLDKTIQENKQATDDYAESNNQAVTLLTGRTEVLEESMTSSGNEFNALVELVGRLEKKLDETEHELTKTQLNNLKQEIHIRTMHNLQIYDGHNMFVDTFTTDDEIDWDLSVRGRWDSIQKSIGMSGEPTAKIKQLSIPTSVLISRDGSSDEAVAQSFTVDKDQQMDRISIYVEAHKETTWQPLVVRMTTSRGGAALVSVTIPIEEISGGWIDVDFPNLNLTAMTEYYIEIHTDDIYGYRIGADLTDTYLAGTSFSRFGSAWTDNNHDIGFTMWAYPAADELNGIIYTKMRQIETEPLSIVFEKDDMLIDGIVNYDVSRDNGLTWKILQSGMETSLEDLPPGNELIIRANITGGSYINAWGYVLKRGDS